MTKASTSESVTLRIPSDVLSNIESIAEATERSRSYIIVRALRTYLLSEGSDILEAIKGREQIAAGDHEAGPAPNPADVTQVTVPAGRIRSTRPLSPSTVLANMPRAPPL